MAQQGKTKPFCCSFRRFKKSVAPHHSAATLPNETQEPLREWARSVPATLFVGPCGGLRNEKTYCRCGLLFHSSRVLWIDSKPRFSQIIAADGGITVRIRTSRRRGQGLRADLSHPLRAHARSG